MKQTERGMRIGRTPLGRVAEAGIALTVVVSALALGGAEVHVQLACAGALIVCGVLGLFGKALKRIPAPAVVLAGLGVFSLLQTVPLPIGALRIISPRAAAIWSDALLPLHEQVKFGTASLDPDASTLEAAKWLGYSLAFALAAAFGARRGATKGIVLVFASALLVAVATLGHQLVGAKTVFGLYAPKFSIAAERIGPFLNRNSLAGYLVLGSLCGFGLILSTRTSAPRWLCLVGTPIIATPAILSGSRGGLAAFLLGVIGLGILVLSRERLRHPGWYRGGAAAAAFAVAIVFALLGVRDSWREINHTDIDKLKLAVWVLPLVRDFPLLGVGRGAFESVFPHYKPTADHLDFFYPENIVAQWISEWGFIVGALGLMSMLWLCRPSQLGFGRQMSVSGAIVGVFALLAQNLVDFSLELFAPMLAVVVVLGCTWGQHRASVRSASPRTDTSRIVPKVVVALGLVAMGLSMARGVRPVSTDRLELQSEYVRLAGNKDATAVAGFWKDLRAAMLRHPAEAYFPRLGALFALRGSDVEPLPWISAALRRWEGDSRSHWILARVLQRHGLLPQALLEARLSVERDPAMAAVVGTTVAQWSTRLEDIERVALPGERGARVRFYVASAPALAKYPELRGQLLREAVAQDPLFAPAQWALAAELLRLGEAGMTPELSRAILARASALDEIKPGSADGSMVRLQHYILTDQPSFAAVALSERCPSLEHAERVRCWWALLGAAVGHQWSKNIAETAARHYVKAACTVEDTCGPALSQAGDAMGALGAWDLALDFFEGAVSRDPDAVANLLRVANAATVLQRSTVAMRALSMAAARAGSNSELAARVEAQRQAILREAMSR